MQNANWITNQVFPRFTFIHIAKMSATIHIHHCWM